MSTLPSVALSELSDNTYFSTTAPARQYSPNPAVNAAIHDLLALGFSPIPVAPAFPAEQYPSKRNSNQPRFNGKNPSFIDLHGNPHEVKGWKAYENTLPAESDLQEWFIHPDTRLGQIAVSVDGKRRVIDIDRKDFSSDEHFERVVQPLIEMATTLDKTPGGGLHLTCEFPSDPLAELGKQQANIGLGDVDHAGELPQFVVCPPTPGYTRIKAGPPLKIGSLSELGIRPTKAHTPPAEPAPPPAPNVAPTALPVATQGSAVSLTELASKKIQELLKSLGQDRSDGLTKIARELYGWENLALAENIALLDSADSILAAVATASGLDGERATRILATLNREKCEPGIGLARGRDVALNRLRNAAGVTIEKPAANNGEIQLEDEDTAGRVAYRHLYDGEQYIRIGNEFFKWVGTHYEARTEQQETHRISHLLNRCIRVIESKDQITITRPYATSRAVSDAYTWCLRHVRNVELNDINPGGLNLANGVLIPDYSSGVPTFTLVPHSPERVDTYCAPVAYDPLADTTEADRLLSAIPSEFRQTTLRVLSAAIDLKSVRKSVGRDVRAMFWAGEGSNGKDAIRAACASIFGHHGVTSVSVRSFSIYDEGKQPWKLAPLLNSRINWPSENSAKESINKIESLKAVVAGTGEIDYERKNQDAQQFTPKCICVFNTNDTQINLDHRSEAMASRYLIVPFPYRFTKNPQGPNDIKADPRFVYDEAWVQDVVCPGLLNLLLKEFTAIFTEGFSYDVFEDVMNKNLENSSHFYQFKAETNLIEDPGAITPIAEIWQRLRSWYETEEILRIDGNSREIWNEDTRPGDRYIKTKEQLGQRLRKVFPSAEAYRNKDGRGIKGIRFASHAEIALRQVTTFQEYCKIVELYGKPEVDKGWQFLTPEQQKTITDLAPTTTTETAEISDNDAALQAAIMIEAANSNEPEALAHFETFSKQSKAKIWAAIPEETRPAVTALAEKYKASKGGEPQ